MRKCLKQPGALPKHMPALDGIRGIAILLVILTHVAAGRAMAFYIYKDTTGQLPSFALPYVLEKIAAFAGCGVTLFFVVSAFTLTHRALSGEREIFGYALRRIARVGPGYWIAGLCYTLFTASTPRLYAPNGVTWSDAVIAAAFGSAWQGGAAIAIVPGGWSVSCEMAFYIALPPVIWLVNARISRALVLTSLAMSIAQFRARYIMGAGNWDWTAYTNPIEQAPVFMLGITAALVARQFALPRSPGLAVLVLFGAICALPFSPILNWFFLTHVQFAAFATVAVALAASHPPCILVTRMLRRTGEVSYSMYLLHFAILFPSLQLAEWLVPADDWRTMIIHMVVTSFVSFCCANATYKYIEQPAIRWAGRFIDRSSGIFKSTT